jgi:type I restriction enzyme S subunit
VSFPLVKFEDITRLITCGVAKKPEYVGKGIPFLSAKNVKKGEVLFKGFNCISEETHKALTKHNKPMRGDILYTRVGSVGEAAIVETDEEFSVFVSLTLIKLDVKKVDSKYMKYLLNSEKFKRKAHANLTGIGVGNLNVSVVREFLIPLPPLETQKQIAAVLEKADQLRKDCKQMEQELNSLVQSVFIDMFGDPVTNPKEWEVKPFSAVSNVVTGNTPSRAKSEFYGPHIEWIKSGNINTPSHYLTEATEYLSESGKTVGRSVQSGSVLMTCIAGSPECIGNVAIANREVTFNQQINALVPKKDLLNTEFLYVLLIVGKKIIQSASTNSMKGMISKGKLGEICLPIPPYEKQCDFSKKFTKLELTISEYGEQVEQAEEMFNSLMQKAFNGELNLKAAI